MSEAKPQRKKQEKLASDSPQSARELAKLRGCSSRQLRREYHDKHGCSPQKWLIAKKIQRAKESLDAGDQVKTAADKAGFKPPSYFAKVFKAHTGLSPKQYQRRARPGPANGGYAI